MLRADVARHRMSCVLQNEGSLCTGLSTVTVSLARLHMSTTCPMEKHCYASCTRYHVTILSMALAAQAVLRGDLRASAASDAAGNP